MDTIFLRDIRIDIRIGVQDWERCQPQTIQLDLDIGLPHANACSSDRVEDTIDYARVIARIEAALAARPFHLVEAAAQHIADIVRGEFGAPWVRVSLAKVGLVPHVRLLGVTIERGTR